MYSFKLTDNFLSKEEQKVFNDYLAYHGLEENIWPVFSCLFKSNTKNTKPFLLKVYKDSNLFGVSILIECKGYGQALFKNSFLSGLINTFKIPFYLWIKFGCCMDMMSNPGFVKDPKKSEEVFTAMAGYMKKNLILSIVTDYSKNASLFARSSILPALPHAIIDTSQMNDINDYLKGYKNINRKMRVLKNKGGTIVIQENPLGDEDILTVKKCFLSTVEKSVFYLPYQNLYLNAAVTVSKINLEKVLYFFVKLNNEIIGYQAAIWTGKHLNALHGAFDRNRSSNYHAYDILFVKMAEFAIEHKLNSVDFGAVLNVTKKRMVNKTVEMSYFLMSKYAVIQWLFNIFLKFTKIQGKEQLKFR